MWFFFFHMWVRTAQNKRTPFLNGPVGQPNVHIGVEVGPCSRFCSLGSYAPLKKKKNWTILFVFYLKVVFRCIQTKSNLKVNLHLATLGTLNYVVLIPHFKTSQSWKFWNVGVSSTLSLLGNRYIVIMIKQCYYDEGIRLLARKVSESCIRKQVTT